MAAQVVRVLVSVCVALAVALLAAIAQSSEKPQPAERPAEKPAERAMTASERLAACAKKYAEAKTYSDEGTLVTEFKVPNGGPEIADKKPFRTAFERDGRFYWEFRSSATPGAKPDQKYVIWSTDQSTFESYWTLTKQNSSFGNLMMALAGPTGVSGGSALAITPLLRPDALGAHRITKLTEPTDKGTEVVDGQECTKVEGKGMQGVVTIWIDKEHAIRKVYQVTEIDPSKLPAGPAKDMGKFTSKTTMTFKPVFDQKVADDRLAPPAEAK